MSDRQGYLCILTCMYSLSNSFFLQWNTKVYFKECWGPNNKASHTCLEHADSITSLG